MRLKLFGGLEIESDDGEAIRFASRKSALVVALLALSGAKGMRRDRLCAILWEDRGETQARASLRQALVEIRRQFTQMGRPAASLTGETDVVALSMSHFSIDALRFDAIWNSEEPGTLAEAASLYQGELLTGIDMPQAATDWISPLRQGYANKALQLVDHLSARADLSTSAVRQCEELAHRLLRTDPAAEEAHRALIRLYLLKGKSSAAARQLQLCTDALRNFLGVAPERQTIALLEQQQPTSAAKTGPAIQASIHEKRDWPSVAVLPFDNLSGPQDALLAEGFVEEITATLSRIRDFVVIARQSASAGSEAMKDVKELGENLGVRYVIQGALRRAGSIIRITVRLVEAENRALVWTERYEGNTQDIFSLQDRIAAQVAGAMHPAILKAEIEAARRKAPDSLKAYGLVLQAQSKMWKRTEAENREGLALLQRAVALDPHYGRAYALLAWCHSQNIVYLWALDPDHERNLSRAAIDAAARLVVDDPLAMTAIGAALGQALDQHGRALRYVEAALALDPNSAWAWARLGWLKIHNQAYDEAIACFETAIRLSPLDPLIYNFKFGIAACLGHMERYKEAARMLQNILDLYPDSAWGHRMLSAFAALAGDLETARTSMEHLKRSQPRVSVAMMKTHHPSRNVPGVFDRLVKGWRIAGLPEE